MPAPSEKSGGAVFWGLLLVLATVVGFALGGLGVFFYLRDYSGATRHTEGEMSQTRVASDQVAPAALGRIEPKDGILYLGVSTPDRIAKILVKEGDRVTSGKPLVELESETLRQLEVESSQIERKEAKKRLEATKASGEAQIKVEQLRLDQVEQFSPLELDVQQSKIKFLESQVANAERDYERLEKSGDSIARQRIERQRLLWQQAQEELTAAKMQYKKLSSGQPLDVELAKARLASAQAELVRAQSATSLEQLNNQTAQAEARSRASRVVAPSGGTILRLLAHEGDLVQGKPIVQMANLEKMIVVAEVPISFIPRIQEGDPATITSRVLEKLDPKNKELRGTVYSIGRMAGKPQVASTDPLASVDFRIVEVKILLEQNEPAAHYIGHEVSVTIHPRKQKDHQP